MKTNEGRFPTLQIVRKYEPRKSEVYLSRNYTSMLSSYRPDFARIAIKQDRAAGIPLGTR
jgi:hypothetical protein